MTSQTGSTSTQTPGPAFNFSRMINMGQYGDLSTNAERAAFTMMVREYMVWAREPTAQPQISLATRQSAHLALAGKIRSQKAWPLIRQAAYEFRSPPADFGGLPHPLRQALTVAKAAKLLPTSPSPVSQSQQFEEDIVWRKWEVSIQYVAYLRGLVDGTGAEQVQAAKSSLSQLSGALSGAKVGATKSGTGDDDDDSDEGDGDPMHVVSGGE